MRWPIVLVIALVVGGGAWFALRAGDESAQMLKPGSIDRRGPDTAAISAPVAPVLGGSGAAEPEPPVISSVVPPMVPPVSPGSARIGVTAGAAKDPGQAFASQPRDPKWAPKIEREIKQRFQAIRGAAGSGATLDAAECRQDVCELSISGSEEQLSTVMAGLETPRGLHGFASSILLTSPAPGAGGKSMLKVYASFGRP